MLSGLNTNYSSEKTNELCLMNKISYIKKSGWKVIFFMVCFTFALAASGEREVKNPPNVLMICIDDLNDWVGCMKGHPNTHTPHIDRDRKSVV